MVALRFNFGHFPHEGLAWSDTFKLWCVGRPNRFLKRYILFETRRLLLQGRVEVLSCADGTAAIFSILCCLRHILFDKLVDLLVHSKLRCYLVLHCVH